MKTIRVTRLRTDHLIEPLGIDSAAPEFSWQLNASASTGGVTQDSWQIQVTATTGFDDELEWDSGHRRGDLPFGATYGGTALRSGTRYLWRVRIRDSDGAESAWSEAASFETGILLESEWHASWVTAATGSIGGKEPLYLRGSLEVAAPVLRARAYASALGWYRLFVNGQDLTGAALVPRYTPYGSTVEYQVYDVTNSFTEGANTVAMAVGDGRFRGHIGFFDRREVYGRDLAGLIQIRLDLADGSTVEFVTNDTWFAGPGRITSSDPKLGELVDLRVPDDDWLSANEPPKRFTPAMVLPPHPRRLIAEETPRVQTVERFTPTLWRSPSGKQLVDLRQNIAGVLRIRLQGKAGTTVRMTFGEALTPKGEFDPMWIVQNPKKPWFQRDEVVLDGAEQWWQPWFTIHGFRYVEIEGLDHDLTQDDVEGVALSTDVETAGSFTASDERLSRLWQNVYWSTRSNFTDTPTDCPTRERSGWTGDIQVFTPTATGIVDSQSFLRRYLRNLAIEQKPNGNVSPWVPSERSGDVGFLPNFVNDFLGNSVGWGDAAVMTPWDLYRYYGDVDVLERQYVSMRRWVDRLGREAARRGPQRWFSKSTGAHERYIIDTGFHWGEWLRPGEEFPSNFLDGITHGAVLATAYFEHSSRLLAQTAALLGRRKHAEHYGRIADRVRAAWRAAFLRAGGARIGRDLQDDYVRALAFGLLDGDEKIAAGNRLVELIRAADNHLATGFLSTPMLLTALVDTGHQEVAYQLLLQDTAPSWLHEVDRGATTIWETWEGYDDTDHAQSSHNHYALGSVAGWLREQLLGITPASPGYRRVRFAPVVGGGLDWAEGSVETPFGTAALRWDATGHGPDSECVIAVTVPAGSDAEVVLPDGTTHRVGSGSFTFTAPLHAR